MANNFEDLIEQPKKKSGKKNLEMAKEKLVLTPDPIALQEREDKVNKALKELQNVAPKIDPKDVLSAEELLPCPWCKNEDLKQVHFNGKFIVECATCLAVLMAKKKSVVNKQWNDLSKRGVPATRRFKIAGELIVTTKDFPPTPEMDEMTVKGIVTRVAPNGKYASSLPLIIQLQAMQATLGRVKLKSVTEIPNNREEEE